MGPTESTFGITFDKGHFIAFSIGGEVSGGETNIFPHNRALNRGRSDEGKVYRRMETFAANHPGTLFFHRPIYERETDTPNWLEVGILDSICRCGLKSLTIDQTKRSGQRQPALAI